MAQQVVIVGGGAVGTHLAALLLAGGHQAGPFSFRIQCR